MKIKRKADIKRKEFEIRLYFFYVKNFEIELDSWIKFKTFIFVVTSLTHAVIHTEHFALMRVSNSLLIVSIQRKNRNIGEKVLKIMGTVAKRKLD